MDIPRAIDAATRGREPRRRRGARRGGAADIKCRTRRALVAAAPRMPRESSVGTGPGACRPRPREERARAQVLFILALWQPALEIAAFDATTEVVHVRRRNLLGIARFDLAVAMENVDAVTVTEHGVHDLLVGRALRADARDLVPLGNATRAGTFFPRRGFEQAVEILVARSFYRRAF